MKVKKEMIKNLDNIKKLCVFDFDQTLMKTPERKIGIELWENFYDKKYPYKDWWSNMESLNLEIFGDYIKPYDKILFDFRINTNKNDIWVIMLTHRLPKFKDIIDIILNKFNIKFDDQLFRRSYFLTKADDLDEYIPRFKNLKEIEIWEDRDKEIEILKDWAYKVEPWLNLNININEIKI